MSFEKVKENLEKRGFIVRVFATGAEAAAYLNKEIDGVSVACGGSVTVSELGLLDSLATHNEVWSHGDPKQVEKYGVEFLRQKAMTTEAYICSANGLSEGGQIVNIDGRGNRIASTAFGHNRVYFVIGKNKLAPDLEGAIWRARNIAAPKNAQRLHMKTPCAVRADKCYDCASPDRICSGFMILERVMRGQKTEVLLVEEELGY